MIYEVLIWPDDGLRVVAETVLDPKDESLQEIYDNMLETMLSYNAEGLAATQVGIAKRIVAYLDSEREPQIIANPVIISREGESFSKEGCLSFPGVHQKIKRDASVVVEGFTSEGNAVKLRLAGLQAVAMQHEIDHLNGIVMLDHMGKLQRKMAVKRLNKIKKRLKREDEAIAEALKKAKRENKALSLT